MNEPRSGRQEEESFMPSGLMERPTGHRGNEDHRENRDFDPTNDSKGNSFSPPEFPGLKDMNL